MSRNECDQKQDRENSAALQPNDCIKNEIYADNFLSVSSEINCSGCNDKCDQSCIASDSVKCENCILLKNKENALEYVNFDTSSAENNDCNITGNHNTEELSNRYPSVLGSSKIPKTGIGTEGMESCSNLENCSSEEKNCDIKTFTKYNVDCCKTLEKAKDYQEETNKDFSISSVNCTGAELKELSNDSSMPNAITVCDNSGTIFSESVKKESAFCDLPADVLDNVTTSPMCLKSVGSHDVYFENGISSNSNENNLDNNVINSLNDDLEIVERNMVHSDAKDSNISNKESIINVDLNNYDCAEKISKVNVQNNFVIDESDAVLNSNDCCDNEPNAKTLHSIDACNKLNTIILGQNKIDVESTNLLIPTQLNNNNGEVHFDEVLNSDALQLSDVNHCKPDIDILPTTSFHSESHHIDASVQHSVDRETESSSHAVCSESRVEYLSEQTQTDPCTNSDCCSSLQNTVDYTCLYSSVFKTVSSDSQQEKFRSAFNDRGCDINCMKEKCVEWKDKSDKIDYRHLDERVEGRTCLLSSSNSLQSENKNGLVCHFDGGSDGVESSCSDDFEQDRLTGEEDSQEECLTECGDALPNDAFDVPKKPILNGLPNSSSNLKRKLTDDLSVARPNKKKKSAIQFEGVTVFYFPRSQGFTCVPSQGGSTLGMARRHVLIRRFSLAEHAAEQRRAHREYLIKIKHQQNKETGSRGSSSEDSEEASDVSDSELEADSYYFLQPLAIRQRKALLRQSGIRQIEGDEKEECRDIRTSRELCGCQCKIYCDPEICQCSLSGIKCQVDRHNFPCGCSREGCMNENGRIEFNPIRVRTHFLHTLMRMEIEKRQHEQNSWQEQQAVNETEKWLNFSSSANGYNTNGVTSGNLPFFNNQTSCDLTSSTNNVDVSCIGSVSGVSCTDCDSRQIATGTSTLYLQQENMTDFSSSSCSVLSGSFDNGVSYSQCPDFSLPSGAFASSFGYNPAGGVSPAVSSCTYSSQSSYGNQGSSSFNTCTTEYPPQSSSDPFKVEIDSCSEFEVNFESSSTSNDPSSKFSARPHTPFEICHFPSAPLVCSNPSFSSSSCLEMPVVQENINDAQLGEKQKDVFNESCNCIEDGTFQEYVEESDCAVEKKAQGPGTAEIAYDVPQNGEEISNGVTDIVQEHSEILNSSSELSPDSQIVSENLGEIVKKSMIETVSA